MQSKVKENVMVSPYYLFFLLHGSQVGISILNYQSRISEGAGQDAWVSIVAAGLSTNLLFFMMLYIMKHSSREDLCSFHTDHFGKLIGGMLNLVVALYFGAAGLLVFHSYIELLQIWVFDGISNWEYALVLAVLIYYLVCGGFRLVAGISFWGVIIPSFLNLVLVYIFNYREFTYLMPFFNHGVKDYFSSATQAGTMYFGFETVLVYFPFIKNRNASRKWGHIGLLYTTLLYWVVTVITFMFFTQGKLKLLTWPTLTMIKIISFPFLERIEFIFIFTWLFVILPVICIYLWSAVRAVKITLPRIKPTLILLIFIGSYFLFSSLLVDISYTETLINVVKYCGFTFLYGYIPLLFMISLIKAMLKKRKANAPERGATDTKM